MEFDRKHGSTEGAGEHSKTIPVFVGGAPRSGTSVLHALLCTSPRANPYVGECSFLTALVAAFDRGDNTFQGHTSYYFDSREDYVRYCSRMLETLVADFSAHLGAGGLLVLKDPFLTRRFASVKMLLPNARFVVVVRDPRECIASRIRVYLRGNRKKPDQATLDNFYREYVAGYEHVARERQTLGDSLLLISYAELAKRSAIPMLLDFGFYDINIDRIWKDARKHYGEKGTAWQTNLFGSTLSDASVNKTADVLTPDLEADILARCGPAAEARAGGLTVAPRPSLPISKGLEWRLAASAPDERPASAHQVNGRPVPGEALMNLRIPFKGSRDYLRGADLFNALIAETGSDRDITLTMFKPMTKRLVAVKADLSIPKPDAAVAQFCAGKDCWFINQTDEEVDERVPYDEAGVASKGVVSERIMSGPVTSSLIDTIVAYNKALLTAVTGTRDWWFVRLEMSKVPPTAEQVSVRLMLQSRLNKSSIDVDGDEIGFIYYSVKT